MTDAVAELIDAAREAATGPMASAAGWLGAGHTDNEDKMAADLRAAGERLLTAATELVMAAGVPS